MKIISAFCLGAALVALVTMSVDRRRPAKRTGAAIRVERVTDDPYLYMTGAEIKRDMMGSTVQHLKANLDKLADLKPEPLTLTGAFGQWQKQRQTGQ